MTAAASLHGNHRVDADHIAASCRRVHFHGPQRRRRLRPCGLRFAFGMGNYFSNLFGARARDGGLGVYREWVEVDARDLTVLTRDGDEAEAARVVSRRVGDARKAALEAAAAPRATQRVYYKDALAGTRRYDKRLGQIDSDIRFYDEKLAELRRPAKAPAESPKEDLSELFIPLTADEEHKVHDCLYGSGSSSKILVIHEPSNIEISTEKFQCLRPGGWLNDEIINLYLELLKEREVREPKRFLKCHFFNTFFYKKLACGKTGYDYRSVRRWTTHKKLGYGLIECEKIFVPVHKDIHWCLAIINMKEKTLQYLDSLGGMDYDVLRVLARYIMEEVKDKSDKDIDASSWQDEPVDSLPLQKNGWDCGMFMLKYIDFHSRGLKLSFSQEHMEYFRKKTVKEILRLRAD